MDYLIPAEKPWSGIVRKGQTIRIIDSEGQQAVDTLFYKADDFSERYSGQDTLRVQGNAYVGIGTKLMSNEGNVMLTVTADSCGRHDTSAGACSCESNTVRFGHDTKYLHACRDNFLLEVTKHGMGKRDIVPNINFFMNVPIDPSGQMTIVDGLSKAGDHVELLAEMDVLCVISNCPQVNNPCNGF
ncbi:MAG: urea amidolyase associated protein UAAP2, partial [Devosia sp.]